LFLSAHEVEGIAERAYENLEGVEANMKFLAQNKALIFQ
jgi:hypothetical protein